jgi:hypothetical protein
MNELEEIRALLPEHAPPSDQLVADVRGRVLSGAKPASRRPRLLVPRAVATAAAVAAVAVVSLPGNDNAPARGQQGTERQAPRTARDILLVAADRAADQAAESGRFWRTRTLESYAVPDGPYGTPPNTYGLEQRNVTETWLSGDGHESDWYGHRGIGLHPTDEAAWRADGSPTEWDLPVAPLAAPSEGEVYELPGESQILPGMTAKVSELPTDAKQLRTFLLEHSQHQLTDPRVEAEYLFGCAVMLLAEVPAPPAVRAAALRLIADLGGVESTGQVTDPLGRKGTGITLKIDPAAEYTAAADVVIDAADGALLSVRYSVTPNGKPVAKEYYVAVLDTGWTDEDPGVPSAEVP